MILAIEGPDGERQAALSEFPFFVGRQPENHLVLADSRVSRTHARILQDSGGLWIEDAGSRLGTTVNGDTVKRQELRAGDVVEVGPYRLTLRMPTPDAFARLREVLELVRSLEGTFSPQSILDGIVDAALRITSSERGFLFLRRGGAVTMAAARSDGGECLSEQCIRVPRRLIDEAISKRDAYVLNFDTERSFDPGQTVVMLDLRSSVFVPLPRADGVLYLDSRITSSDLASGKRELLETLALEASTVIESARGIEERQHRRKLEDELSLARTIQQSLLPRTFPDCGWMRSWGVNIPSRQIGGDSFDVHQLSADEWLISIADVSGKGAGAALLASLIQGALFMSGNDILSAVTKLNRFILDRSQGEQYATMFVGVLSRDGLLRYINAGHVAPLLVGRTSLDSSGMPVGLIEIATWEEQQVQLHTGDRLIAYSDGLSDALDVNELDTTDAGLRQTLKQFESPEDDVTVLVVDFEPPCFQLPKFN